MFQIVSNFPIRKLDRFPIRVPIPFSSGEPPLAQPPPAVSAGSVAWRLERPGSSLREASRLEHGLGPRGGLGLGHGPGKSWLGYPQLWEITMLNG